MVPIKFFISCALTHSVRLRYGEDCAVLAVPGVVATRWNGMTIPPRRALPWGWRANGAESYGLTPSVGTDLRGGVVLMV